MQMENEIQFYDHFVLVRLILLMVSHFDHNSYLAIICAVFKTIKF